jgi:diguanylate cyclase (GGDEF)-like protein
MLKGEKTKRSSLFKLTTILSSGIGGGILGFWAHTTGFGAAAHGVENIAIATIITGLSALSAAGCALAFFSGIDAHATEVRVAAETDVLTGLISRNTFLAEMARISDEAKRLKKTAYFLNVEIDRFKQLNDALGYRTGDQLVLTAAERIKKSMPKSAVIGRLAISEFGIIITDDEALPTLEIMLDAMVASLCDPYIIEGRRVIISTSTGGAEINEDYADAVGLLRKANLSVHRARALGRGNWVMFEPEIGRVADHRRWIEAEMQIALERHDFELHYQPQLDLTTGRIAGYEALVRWQHPEKGAVHPIEFIPVAEETGMIAPLGDWVLRKACSDAKHLPDDCFVAVNLSPAQFLLSDMVEVVRSALSESGLEPRRLELEITESLLMEDKEKTALILGEFAKMGVSVAVDDFGTGYSNLTYLSDLPFQKLKIDRSFVSRIETNSNTGAIISTIVGLSRALGVETIAEGVENQAQVTLLMAAGCNSAQGYLFGKPLPITTREIYQQRRAAALH